MWKLCLCLSLFVGHLLGFSLIPSDPRSVTARVFDSQLSDIYDFIGDDEGFNFLKEDTKILDPGENAEQGNQLKLLLKDYNKQEVKQNLEEMSFQSLEAELENLNDKLEALYQKLYNFAALLVSLSDEDILQMADTLDQNPEYYAKVLNNEIGAISLFENWIPRDSFDEDYQLSLESLDVNNKEIRSVFIDEDGKQYWDPDAEYEMIKENFLLSQSPTSKLDEMIRATGVFAIIKSILFDIKLFFTIILNLIKLTKLVRAAELKVILKIMGTIEKIVRCLSLIKHYLIKKIKNFIKEFPWNIVYKIKRVIRLILKIITAILWEVKKILTEVLIKLYYLLRKIESWARIPIELKIYIKQEIYERLGYADEDREEYLEELFEEHEEKTEREKSKELMNIEPIDEDGLGYAIGSGSKPDELSKLFTKKFTKKELKELDRDSYNQDVIYQFSSREYKPNNHNSVEKSDSLVSRSIKDVEYEDEDEDWDFNITVPVGFIENIMKNISVNIEGKENFTITNISNITNTSINHESKGSDLSFNLWSLITIPITFLVFARLYTP